MIIELECNYCGHKWEDMVRNQAEISKMRCPVRNCGHSELRVKDASKKIDYYEGSPPFLPFPDRDKEKVEELDIAKYFGHLYGRSD